MAYVHDMLDPPWGRVTGGPRIHCVQDLRMCHGHDEIQALRAKPAGQY